MDTVETSRLLLRRFTIADGPKLHLVMGNDPEMTWDGTSRSLERTEASIKGRLKHYEDHGFGLWAVIEKLSGEMIGQGGLQLLSGTEEVELVVYVAKRYWNRGIGFEISVGALKYGFTEMDLSRIVSATLPRNRAAQRLAEKLGFRLVLEGNAYGKTVYYYELFRSNFSFQDHFYKIHLGVDRKPRFDFTKSDSMYY
jgi:ribosomal-protein-alanine N-acetyltransferase